MRKVRALIVDDSAVMRRLVGDALGADPAIEVVGTAPNGRIGLERIASLSPDVVVLDMEMPEMDGLETLAAIRVHHARVPVVMFSSLTRKGAEATLEALARGARDYVTKPSALNGDPEATRRVKEELVAKVKALGSRALEPAAAPIAPRAAPTPMPRRPPARVTLLAIGTSTGGPDALARVLPALPADLPVPVVIVQHMPPLFTQLLAARLDARSPLRVVEATAGERLVAGSAWIAPGNQHMVLERAPNGEVRIALNQEAREHSVRPAVDPLFRSAAHLYGAGVLAVVMTGMGQDGHKGCEAVRAAGGQVIVQDRDSSVVWGMPGFVANAGLADAVVPLDGIAEEIVRRLGEHRIAAIAGARCR